MERWHLQQTNFKHCMSVQALTCVCKIPPNCMKPAVALQTDQVSVKMKMDKRPPSESSFFRPGTADVPMLLVHQTPFMRRMMALFGNGIVGMDATHGIVKWGFALFILCVVTNHGFAAPVAIFFVDSETTELIAEALQV